MCLVGSGITLNARLERFVKAEVASGEYRNETEVVEDALTLLEQRDGRFEQWLRDEVVAGHEEYVRDPSKAIPAERVVDQVRTNFRGREARDR